MLIGLLVWAARAHLGWAQALAGRALELSGEHGFGPFEEQAAALVEAQSTA